jgi:hypothetical protein
LAEEFCDGGHYNDAEKAIFGKISYINALWLALIVCDTGARSEIALLQ